MSRLREAGALLIAQGRTLAKAEDMHDWAETLRRLLDKAAQIPTNDQRCGWLLEELQALHRQQIEGAEIFKGIGEKARVQANAIMHAIEHPGARLARRLVAAARGAHVAWRVSR